MRKLSRWTSFKVRGGGQVNPSLRLRGVQALLLAASLLASSVTAAQSREVLLDASARAFFKEGIEFADQGRQVEAIDRFRRAIAIRYSPVIAYNLASMLEGQGELLEACDLLYRIETDGTAEEAMRAEARRLRTQIEPKLARLTIVIPATLEEPVVSLDDLRLIDVQIGAPIPVDPTDHMVALRAGGGVLEEKRFHAGVSENLVIELGQERGALSPQVAAVEHIRRQRSAPEGDRTLVRNPWLWVGVGVVVVTAVVVVGALALSNDSGGPSTVPLMP